MMKYDTALFDLDGTLVNTSQGITEGVKYAIEKMGLKELDYETRCMFIGPPIRDSFKRYCGVSEEVAEEALWVYREYYSTKGLLQCKLYDGIKELLEYLNDKGKEVIVATAKPTEYSEIILEHLGVAKYFKKIVGAALDKSLDNKEKVIKAALDAADNKNAVMIGDTKFDVEAAQANGVPTISILYGFGDKSEMLAMNPTHVEKNVSDLYKYFT